MTLVVETGAGTPGANSFTNAAFALSYLKQRGREDENGWQGLGGTAQDQLLIQAADYITIRFEGCWKGLRLRDIIPGREATGALTLTGLPANAETVTIGGRVFRFVSALTQEDDILIGATIADTLDSLVTAINSGGESDAAVQDLTVRHYEVEATRDASVVTFTASAEGDNGNLIQLAHTITGASVSGAFLAGGKDEGPQPLPFPRTQAFTAEGKAIVGVPYEVRAAQVEYAVRAAAGLPLVSDKTADDTGAGVQRVKEKVGPIEEEKVFVAGASIRTWQAYPAADKLLVPLLKTSEGVIR